MHPESSMPTGLAERFVQRDLVVDGECWLWPGNRTVAGYGTICYGPAKHRRRFYVHRIACALAHGAPIPPGIVVAHTCDRPACVRNDEAGTYVVDGVEYRRYGHLFLTSPLGNVRDMHAKGRAHKGATSREGLRRRLAQCAKLRESDAIEIVVRRAAGESSAALALAYGVSQGTINAVCAGRRWGWLTGVERPAAS